MVYKQTTKSQELKTEKMRGILKCEGNLRSEEHWALVRCLHVFISNTLLLLLEEELLLSSTKLLPTYSSGYCQQQPDSPSGTDF